MRKIIYFALILGVFVSATASSLEERVKQLEERVKALEERLNKLEKKEEKREKIGVVSSSDITDVIVVKPDQKLISYEVLEKRFKPMRLKESLWQRSDQIVLKMAFKNNTGKELSNVAGKVVVFDKKGNKLAEKKININKALNFFKGMTIHPSEVVKMKVEFDVDLRKKEHKEFKELPLSELDVKFFPTKIDFADGTFKYIKYTEK